MYTIKQHPDLSTNGAVTNEIKVENGKLVVSHGNDKAIFDGTQWFINGVSQGDGWFSVEVAESDIVNTTLAAKVLEHTSEEE